MKRSFGSWQSLRAAVFERDNWTCVWCGEWDGVILHCDHLYPQSRGGKDTLENLVTSCERCNLQKHARILPPAWIPVATCWECGTRSHPRGTGELEPEGAFFWCVPCRAQNAETREAENQRDSETGNCDDLTQEQYAWDRVEFADHPEILADRYPQFFKVSA